MEMEIRLLGGERVDAVFDDLTVRTDQDGSAPSPFDLFLAAIGTCAGFYVARFCSERGIPTGGIRLAQRDVVDPATRRVARIEIDIRLPADFPERYREAVIRAAAQCAVKKHLEHPPAIELRATTGVGA